LRDAHVEIANQFFVLDLVRTNVTDDINSPRVPKSVQRNPASFGMIRFRISRTLFADASQKKCRGYDAAIGPPARFDVVFVIRERPPDAGIIA
jgi:hypothetical protein